MLNSAHCQRVFTGIGKKTDRLERVYGKMKAMVRSSTGESCFLRGQATGRGEVIHPRPPPRTSSLQLNLIDFLEFTAGWQA
jgi:hypothetical protein